MTDLDGRCHRRRSAEIGGESVESSSQRSSRPSSSIRSSRTPGASTARSDMVALLPGAHSTPAARPRGRRAVAGRRSRRAPSGDTGHAQRGPAQGGVPRSDARHAVRCCLEAWRGGRRVFSLGGSRRPERPLAEPDHPGAQSQHEHSVATCGVRSGTGPPCRQGRPRRPTAPFVRSGDDGRLRCGCARSVEVRSTRQERTGSAGASRRLAGPVMDSTGGPGMLQALLCRFNVRHGWRVERTEDGRGFRRCRYCRKDDDRGGGSGPAARGAALGL